MDLPTQKDKDDYEAFNAEAEKLYDAIFPVWQPAAEQEVFYKWKACRSTDQLTFFTWWLIVHGPIESIDLFQSGDKDKIREELDKNFEKYVNEDGFLKSCLWNTPPMVLVDAFRKRFQKRSCKYGSTCYQ